MYPIKQNITSMAEDICHTKGLYHWLYNFQGRVI